MAADDKTPPTKGRSDQAIFDDEVARASGRAIVVFGGLATFAAIVMSTIALINSTGDNSTTTVTVTTPATGAAAGGKTALTGDALGKQMFVSGDPSAGVISCGSCHTMAAAGTNSTVGPNLDKELTADPASATRDAIVDPNAEILPGFTANVMPTNYGTTLTKQQLDAVVNYIYRSTNTKAKAAAK